jgi:predicted transcriptional regulator
MTPRWLDKTPLWCHRGDMELGPYVSDLQRQLVDAAANGAEDTRAVAERLAAGLDAAARLVLLDVLSAATGEITRDLAPGSVDMRLRGREIEFVVAQPNTEPDGDDLPAATVHLDDASTSRTTLRLPDALKARVDEAAAADGLSVNTWLVRAIAAALQPKQRRSAQRTLRTGDDFAGWAR